MSFLGFTPETGAEVDEGLHKICFSRCAACDWLYRKAWLVTKWWIWQGFSPSGTSSGGQVCWKDGNCLMCVGIGLDILTGLLCRRTQLDPRRGITCFYCLSVNLVCVWGHQWCVTPWNFSLFSIDKSLKLSPQAVWYLQSPQAVWYLFHVKSPFLTTVSAVLLFWNLDDIGYPTSEAETSLSSLPTASSLHPMFMTIPWPTRLYVLVFRSTIQSVESLDDFCQIVSGYDSYWGSNAPFQYSCVVQYESCIISLFTSTQSRIPSQEPFTGRHHACL